MFERLPERTAESEPPSATQRTRTAKQLKSGEIDELIAGYEAGATLKELGARFGIHPATAGLILKRNGVQLRPRSLTDDQVREATRLYSSGWSSARIGDRLGFNGTTIITALRRCGVMIRDSHGQPGRR